MLYTSFQASFLNYLLAQSTLTALVEDRLYFANFYSLPPIAYPACTFLLADGKDFLGIVRDFPMTAYSHSELHYDESHQVMDVLAGLLDNYILSNAAVIRVTGNPIENYLADPRLYNVNIPLHVTLL